MDNQPFNELRSIQTLIDIMIALRTPVSGCPWDLEQDFASIAPYTIEEAYEVADAIERGDMADLCDELGDLLLQVVYHSQMASEQNAFGFSDVVQAICEKMIRRHPHVFGGDEAKSAGAVKGFWEAIKLQEAKARQDGSNDAPGSALDGVPRALPSLVRAVKLQRKAARVGFDWPTVGPVLDKISEELDELSAELGVGNHDRIEDEIGDLLFAVSNLARHLRIEPEAALERANAKFSRRFRGVEQKLGDTGKSPAQSSLAEMDALWNEVKADERS